MFGHPCLGSVELAVTDPGVNAAHSVGVNLRAGPVGLLLSLTATAPSVNDATSTQLSGGSSSWDENFSSTSSDVAGLHHLKYVRNDLWRR